MRTSCAGGVHLRVPIYYTPCGLTICSQLRRLSLVGRACPWGAAAGLVLGVLAAGSCLGELVGSGNPCLFRLRHLIARSLCSLPTWMSPLGASLLPHGFFCSLVRRQAPPLFLMLFRPSLGCWSLCFLSWCPGSSSRALLRGVALCAGHVVVCWGLGNKVGVEKTPRPLME